MIQRALCGRSFCGVLNSALRTNFRGGQDQQQTSLLIEVLNLILLTVGRAESLMLVKSI